MAQLNLEIRVIGGGQTWTHEFSHKIHHIQVGQLKTSGLTFHDAGPGYTETYQNALAAWKTLVHAIEGVRSIWFVMPKDPEIERFYLKHVQLADAIKNYSLEAYSSERTRGWQTPPDQSIGLFNVTTIPSMFTFDKWTTLGVYYSGATKIWF